MVVRTVWHRVAAFTLAVLTSAGAAHAADGEWVTLFDGKSLDGWEQVGNPERANGK
ncbi:MAG: hypothetical protein U0996_14335 [Planctomycetaceae bacterium]